MLFFMFVIGINQGMQPIAGYNYGVAKFDRMLRCLWLSILSATAMLTVGWRLAMLFPRPDSPHFDPRPHTASYVGLGACRLDMLVFPIVGFQAVVTNFTFQCIGKVKITIFLSLSRQLLLLLPLAYVFPLLWDLDGLLGLAARKHWNSFAGYLVGEARPSLC